MRARLALGVAAAILAATAIPSNAGNPVVDGKRSKGFSFTQAVTTQNNVAGDQAGPLVKQAGQSYGGIYCAPPRCYKKTFVFQPAKGVKGDMVVKAKWTNPVSDYDVYLYTSKSSKESDYVGACGGSASTGEVLVVPMSALKAGKTYVLVVNFQQSYADTVTGSLTWPATFTSKAPQAYAPENATKSAGGGDPLFHAGCAVDGTLM